MRRLLIATMTLLALACGQSKHDEPQAAPTATTVQPERAADAPPPKAPTLAGYDKARRVASGVLARPLDPTLVHRAIDTWPTADEALRRRGRDARVGEVATLLVEGAAEQPRDVGVASVDQWRAIAALVIANVLEDATRGQRADAVVRLRAVATLGRDIDDDATVAAAARACVAVAAGAPDDAALSAACATLADDALEPR